MTYIKAFRMEIRIGERYRHYKGKNYTIVAFGYDADTAEKVVVYQAEYADTEFGKNAMWVRKLSEFSSTVEIAGNTIPRFERISDEQ